MIRITNLRVPITDDRPLTELAAKKLKLPARAVDKIIIYKKSIDARRKNNIFFVYTIDVLTNVHEGQVLSRLKNVKDITKAIYNEEREIATGKLPLDFRPVIIGLGPAGLFAALILARYGYRPLVVERGMDIDSRTQTVENFWHKGIFNEESNVQFGEGGAGTFSDGKLTTRVNDHKMAIILDAFVSAGAAEEIKYLYKPHIGTDRLRIVVKNLRHEIITLGGEVRFLSKVTKIHAQNGVLSGITINDTEYIACSHAFLGIGHSARDTYQMLYDAGVAMEAKPFSIGLRIEHPQQLIDEAQYKESAGHPKLPPADYALVYHDKHTNRTAYSFCMCPGGLVVAAASENGGVVTNGMSLFNRDSKIANSALVVNVTPDDFGPGVLAGVSFQRRYEQLAYSLAGNNFFAPVQAVGDFIKDRKGNRDFITVPTYKPGVLRCNLHECLPPYVAATLVQGIIDFGTKINNFAHPGAVLTGIETRTSAPVRIVRGADFNSVSCRGLYPIGEGAGYAGGIMSAALDGLNAAISFMKLYKPF